MNTLRNTFWALLLLALQSHASLGEGPDELVPSTKYNATGDVGCLLRLFPAATQCPIGVVRHGGGVADIDITMPDGSIVLLHFDGQAFSIDGKDMPFAWDERGMAKISLDNGNRFEVPDIFVYGD